MPQDELAQNAARNFAAHYIYEAQQALVRAMDGLVRDDDRAAMSGAVAAETLIRSAIKVMSK